MRTSGGRGADAWMLLIPVLALVVASTMAEGGLDSVLITLERAIRHSLTAGLAFVSKLF
jgi:hypothetical protein